METEPRQHGGGGGRSAGWNGRDLARRVIQGDQHGPSSVTLRRLDHPCRRWLGLHSYAEVGTGERVADEIVEMLKALKK